MPDIGQVARSRSVDNLQRLYTVVVSLAVTQALRIVLQPYTDPGWTGPPGAVPRDWLMFGALLITLVPFYHGANRYLDATYVTGERSAKPWALIIDFLALFLEGILLFALASFIGKTVPFFVILAILLVFDATWVGITRLTATDEQTKDTGYCVWAVTNLVVAGIVIVVASSNLIAHFWKWDYGSELVLLFVATVRTVYDYVSAWRFYYPSELNAPRPAAPLHQTDDGGGK